jgi:hypothetical protein
MSTGWLLWVSKPVDIIPVNIFTQQLDGGGGPPPETRKADSDGAVGRRGPSMIRLHANSPLSVLSESKSFGVQNAETAYADLSPDLYI